MFEHQSHRRIKTCIPAKEKSASSVCSQVTACFTSTSVASRLPSRRFLRDGKRCRTRGPNLSTGLITGHEVTDRRPYIPDLEPSDFRLFGPSKNLLKKDADVKQAVTYWLQTLNIAFFYAELQASMLRWDRLSTHALCTCRSYNKVLGVRVLTLF